MSSINDVLRTSLLDGDGMRTRRPDLYGLRTSLGLCVPTGWSCIFFECSQRLASFSALIKLFMVSSYFWFFFDDVSIFSWYLSFFISFLLNCLLWIAQRLMNTLSLLHHFCSPSPIVLIFSSSMCGATDFNGDISGSGKGELQTGVTLLQYAIPHCFIARGTGSTFR